MSARNKDLKEEALLYFNQPVLSHFDVARCIGYGEDDSDCYFILLHPNNQRRDVRWHSCVGGFIPLNRLQGQQEVHNAGESGDETWDDFYRLDEWLSLNGAPKETTFVEDYTSRDSDA